MVHELSCITSLNLSLGSHAFPRSHLSKLCDRAQDLDQDRYGQQKSLIKLDQSPSLALGLGRDHQESNLYPINLIQQVSNSINSAVSSFSNSTCAKRERDVELSNSIIDIDQDELKGSARKKLRLTKEQSFMLEGNFKQHNTLNPKQKQILAKSLNLRPRQVEVWFQNRRARTKLKQNEVDCELLKKCYDALTSDNKRLKREIQQLKAIKTTTVPPQFYMQFPAATHAMCPSCVSGSSGGDDTAKFSKTAFSRAPKSQSLFSQLC